MSVSASFNIAFSPSSYCLSCRWAYAFCSQSSPCDGSAWREAPYSSAASFHFDWLANSLAFSRCCSAKSGLHPTRVDEASAAKSANRRMAFIGNPFVFDAGSRSNDIPIALLCQCLAAVCNARSDREGAWGERWAGEAWAFRRSRMGWGDGVGSRGGLGGRRRRVGAPARPRFEERAQVHRLGWAYRADGHRAHDGALRRAIRKDLVGR